MTAAQAVRKSHADVQRLRERSRTGSSINAARDDAAGLAISGEIDHHTKASPLKSE